MITTEEYNIINDWNKKKNLKNFYNLYKNGFRFKRIWSRPVFRVYRIIRNTVTKRYLKIYEDGVKIYDKETVKRTE